MEKDGSRVALLFGFVLALALCAVAGLAAMSALGLLQRRTAPAEPLPRPATSQQATPRPSPRRTPTQAASTPAIPPTPTSVIVVIQPTPPAEPPTATPTSTPSPTDTPTSTPSPTDTETPTPSPTPTNTVTPTPSPYAGPYRAGNGVDLHARRASVTFRLDGELDEWNDVTGQDLSYILSGAEAYGGIADIAGTVYAQWDSGYLYLAARVFDDVLVQTQRGDRIDLGDALITWLDADLMGDFNTETANEDDYQIGLSPGDFSAVSPSTVVWRPQRRADWDQAIMMGTRRRSDGYTLEAAIPWPILAQQPAPGRAFGFAVQLVDNDQPGTLGQDTVLSGSPNLRAGVPTSFGNLILD